VEAVLAKIRRAISEIPSFDRIRRPGRHGRSVFDERVTDELPRERPAPRGHQQMTKRSSLSSGNRVALPVTAAPLPFILLILPFLNFIKSNGYSLFAPEVMLASGLFLVAGAVLGLA